MEEGRGAGGWGGGARGGIKLTQPRAWEAVGWGGGDRGGMRIVQ